MVINDSMTAFDAQTMRLEATTPATLPGGAPAHGGVDLAMRQADWDLLYRAVVARLRLAASASAVAPGGARVGVDVLDCVQALELLHAELARGRGPPVRAGCAPREARAALAFAWKESAGGRATEPGVHHPASHGGPIQPADRRCQRLDGAPVQAVLALS